MHTVDARIRFFSKKMPFKAGHGCDCGLRCFLLLSTREKTPQIVIGLSGWTTDDSAFVLKFGFQAKFAGF